MTEPGYSPEFTATSRGLTAEALLREAARLARFDGTYDALDLADRIDEFLAEPCSNYTAKSWSPTSPQPEDDRNPDVVKQVDEAAPITVNVENLPAVELCMKRLAELGEFLDRLHDEAFPDDPYLLGRLHAEMERLGYGQVRAGGE